MSKYLVYRGADWIAIASDLPTADPFTRHISEKASRSLYRYGLDRPFGETMDQDQAVSIRGIAEQRGLREQSDEREG